MTFKINSSYYGFTLERSQYNEEIKSHMYIFKHDQLKNTLIAIKNDDPNKTFTAGFRTIPEDSTGVAHIIEHSVLSGSEKYPLKDVFEELTKRGLMTFINAFTSADQTVYPFATRNEKEYFNLMDVYMDVTLNPLLQKETFLQEGWHYELTDPSAKIEYKGVVFNEMKGAFSDPFRHVFRAILDNLFSESTYAVDSGGIPENITDLSYEQFVAFHHKFYHPSNAVFCVYGNADLEKELKYLQENFLSKFEYAVPPDTLRYGRDLTEPKSAVQGYAVNPEDDLKDKTYLVVSSALSTVTDYEKDLAFSILSNLLFDSDASPLKTSIVDAGLGKDVAGGYLNHIYKTSMFTVLIGSNPESAEAFQSLYFETLKDLCKNGLDKDLVRAELNSVEFMEREKSLQSQRGMNYLHASMSAVLNGVDPFNALEFDRLFKSVSQKVLNENYFEELIAEFLLDNPRTVFVTLQPDPQKNQQSAQVEQAKLNGYQSSLDNNQVQKLIEETTELLKHQDTPNTPEQLALLPALSLSDLPSELDIPEASVEQVNGVPVFTTELYANSITYLNIGIDISALTPEYLPYMQLFADIFTEIGTDKLDYEHLAKELDTNTGGLSTSYANHTQFENPGEFHPIMWFNTKILRQYVPRAVELLGDIFQNVSFKDRKRIRQIVERNYAWKTQQLIRGGPDMPAIRVRSYLSKAGSYMENLEGLTSYFALKELSANYDKLEDEFIQRLSILKDVLFNRENLTLSLTASEEDLTLFQQHQQAFLNRFGSESHPHPEIKFDQAVINEAFLIPAEVVFAVQGGNLFKSGAKYHGYLEVIESILSREFLHNQIRVQGGAYGTWMDVHPFTGDVILVSYRDPNVRKTYEVYERVYTAIENLELSSEALEQWCIKAFSRFDPLLSPAAKGTRARNDKLSGIPRELRLKTIQEIKTCTVKDMKQYAEPFKEMLKKPYRSIIGSKSKIEADKNLFNQLIEV